MNLKDNLKRLRKENNLSQEDLAEKLGVSRQSVSKWESGQAYPEMDKVLQICQMFNLNIDELLNQNIKEVNNAKQSKINVNKYLDDFLDYVTKTIDMFSSMKFKSKIKCIFEQLLISGFLVLIAIIIGALASTLITKLLMFIPWNYLYVIRNILESIYIILSIIIGLTLLLHIFKVRYLDYYVIVEEDETIDEGNKEEPKESKKIYLEKKKEKIIIRDPRHSEYRFIKGLLKCILFIVKMIIASFMILLFMSLIFLVVMLILSFLFIKTGLVFLGGLLILLASFVINILVLIICYNFIVGQSTKKNKLALTFLIALISIGVGIASVAIGITKFKIVDSTLDSSYSRTTQEVNMQKDLVIFDYYGIEYVESDNNNLKIEIRHSDLRTPEIILNNNYLNINIHSSEQDIFKSINRIISDINSKKIVDYYNSDIVIYTTKKNIEILKSNSRNYEIEENNRMYY